MTLEKASLHELKAIAICCLPTCHRYHDYDPLFELSCVVLVTCPGRLTALAEQDQDTQERCN
jgi:hypothetical protein